MNFILQGGAPTHQPYLPTTDEVTHLLDNQYAIFQHLEGQVEFYKVC